MGPYLQAFRLLDVVPVPPQAKASRAIVYTPKVHNTPRIVDKEITFLHERLSWGIEWELQTPKDLAKLSKSCGPCAERRRGGPAQDTGAGTAPRPPRQDRHRPGPDRHARHRKAPGPLPAALQPGRVRPPLPAAVSRRAGIRPDPPLAELHLDDTADFTRGEAVAAITRITNGNFRLTGRLIAQIQRILDINHLSVVTSEVVEAARESLVIGVI